MKYLRLRPGARLLALLALAAVSASGVAHAQAARLASSDVRDEAGMFQAGVIAQARAALERIEERYHVSILIETVESLRGRPLDTVALEHARRSGVNGLYILIAQQDRKIEALSSPRAPAAVARHRRDVRDAFADEFHKGDVNAGLVRGVQEIEKVLATLKAEAEPASERDPVASRVAEGRNAPEKASTPLVVRNQVRLTLAGARRILAGAEAKAEALGLKMNIAVVDDGGHLIAFERMEGARPASGYTATTKAVTAATFRQPSGPISRGAGPPDPLLNISLQNAASASGGKITSLLGGVPVVVEGQVIGGVGVGGGSGEQDAEVARAGVDTLVGEVLSSRPKGE